MVLAMDGPKDSLIQLQDGLSSEMMRVYRSEDRIGVGLGSCLKNVYAIATGLSDGLGLGDNARAALLTRSMSEMVDLGVALGGEVETFMGLSGFGEAVFNPGHRSNRGQCWSRMDGSDGHDQVGACPLLW